MRLAFISFLLTLSAILMSQHVYGKEHWLKQVFRFDEIEIVWPGSFTSDHKDQCKPWCAYQQNGGHGFRFGIFGYIALTNSYKDPGQVYYLEIEKFELDIDVAKVGIAAWILRIGGYKSEERTEIYYIDGDGKSRNVKKYEDMTVGPIPWPVFQLGINPLAITEAISNKNFTREGDKFWIKYNIIYFPAVRIQWWSAEINYNF